MKRILNGIIMAITVFSFVSLGWAASISGKIVKIDEKGSFYHVKDDQGKEQKVHFDKTTQKSGTIEVGSMVTIDEENGHAKSITAQEKMEKEKK